MSKNQKRAFALMVLLMLLFRWLPAVSLPANAAAIPDFRIESSSLTPKTGDIITVSFIAVNNDPQAITAFDGKITFNSNFFTYYRYIIPEEMTGKVFCYDDEDIKASSVGFTFADASGAKIPGNAKNVVFFQVEFMAVNNRANSVNFSALINSCTVGSERVTVVVPSITVSAKTTAPTTTTTQTTTTTTSAVQLSDDCSLRELTVAPGELSPVFNNDQVAYTVTVDNEIANMRIAATPNSDYALVTGTGVKDLVVGMNSFTVTVTAQDGTKRSYGIIVYRSETSASEAQISATDSTATQTTTQTTTTQGTLYYPTTGTTAVSGGSSDDSAVKIIGIVFGEIALFFFGFLSGFFIDKNIKGKRAAEQNASFYQQPMPMQQIPMQQMPMLQPSALAQPIPQEPVRDDFTSFDPGYQTYSGYEEYEEDDYYN